MRMTEARWLNEDEPRALLRRACRGAGDRKARLFACACARMLWADVPRRGRDALRLCERFADGRAAAEDLVTARDSAYRDVRDSGDDSPDDAGMRRDCAAYAAWISAAEDLDAEQAYFVTSWVWHGVLALRPPSLGGDVRREAAEHRTPASLGLTARQCRLVRCVFANPFRKPEAAAAWRSPDVVRLAEAAYDRRDEASGELDPARLLVLSDALEEAGCADAPFLGHLRTPGPHARGCWPLDLLTRGRPLPPAKPKRKAR